MYEKSATRSQQFKIVKTLNFFVWFRRKKKPYPSLPPNTQVKNKVTLAYSLHLASILIFLYSRVHTSWKLKPILGCVPINQNSDNAAKPTAFGTDYKKDQMRSKTIAAVEHVLVLPKSTLHCLVKELGESKSV